jgi:plastocyanin
MRTSTCFAVASVIITATIGACSSSSTGSTGAEATGDTGTGGTVSIASSGATTATAGTGGATTTASSAASTGTGGSAGINGCDPAAATDLTGMAAVTINFGAALGSHYDKTCIKVDVGTSVTFAGDFVSHPLEAGNTPPATDNTSPIKETTAGMSKTFPLPTAGTFGFFCMFHYTSGMEGAIIVQ